MLRLPHHDGSPLHHERRRSTHAHTATTPTTAGASVHAGHHGGRQDGAQPQSRRRAAAAPSHAERRRSRAQWRLVDECLFELPEPAATAPSNHDVTVQTAGGADQRSVHSAGDQASVSTNNSRNTWKQKQGGGGGSRCSSSDGMMAPELAKMHVRTARRVVEGKKKLAAVVCHRCVF